jgi:hypothetical protein
MTRVVFHGESDMTPLNTKNCRGAPVTRREWFLVAIGSLCGSAFLYVALAPASLWAHVTCGILGIVSGGFAFTVVCLLMRTITPRSNRLQKVSQWLAGTTNTQEVGTIGGRH